VLRSWHKTKSHICPKRPLFTEFRLGSKFPLAPLKNWPLAPTCILLGTQGKQTLIILIIIYVGNVPNMVKTIHIGSFAQFGLIFFVGPTWFYGGRWQQKEIRALADWHSGHCVCPKTDGHGFESPPRCNIFCPLMYIAMMLYKLTAHCLFWCLRLRKINVLKYEDVFVPWQKGHCGLVALSLLATLMRHKIESGKGLGR
jgi:hypothetical protein